MSNILSLRLAVSLMAPGQQTESSIKLLMHSGYVVHVFANIKVYHLNMVC